MNDLDKFYRLALNILNYKLTHRTATVINNKLHSIDIQITWLERLRFMNSKPYSILLQTERYWGRDKSFNEYCDEEEPSSVQTIIDFIKDHCYIEIVQELLKGIQ